MSVKTYKNVAAMQRLSGGGRVKKQRGGEPQFRTDPSGRRGQAAYYGHVAPKAARKQLAKQPPGRRAANIGPGGWSTGGKVAKAAGGRVRKQGGGPGRVGPKRLVAPKWRPDASMISGRHQQDYQAALRGNARARAAQRPGGKTGGRATKAKGGKAKR